jgi:putative addiction module component (TIGR02574 family)
MMSNEANKLLDSVLRLAEEDRATIAEHLIASLDRVTDDNAERMWQEEIAKRIMEIDSGTVTLVPWEEARKRLRGTYRADT